MKIVNSTLIVTTDGDGATTETKAVEQNFTEGLAYAIPELGDGLWTVDKIGPVATNFVGGKSVATTRVFVGPAEPGSVATVSSEGAWSSGSRFSAKSAGKPVPRPTQKTRHTPK